MHIFPTLLWALKKQPHFLDPPENSIISRAEKQKLSLGNTWDGRSPVLLGVDGRLHEKSVILPQLLLGFLQVQPEVPRF